MNISEFQITKSGNTYCFAFPGKKHLNNIFSQIYKNTSELSFYITNYSGSNTYFGEKYWAKHGIKFSKGSKPGSYIFTGENIDFIVNDKIECVNIAVCRGKNPSRDNVMDVIKVKPDNTMSFHSNNFDLIIECLAYQISHPLYFDFSAKYDHKKFTDFLKSFLNKDFTGKGEIYYKSLSLKKGFNFKVSLTHKGAEPKFYEIGFKENKWYYDEIGTMKTNSKLKYMPKLEKINYFYVSIFFMVVISGILLISTKLRFNIIIFALAALLFFSLLKYIYKKVKVIIGFKIAVKQNE